MKIRIEFFKKFNYAILMILFFTLPQLAYANNSGNNLSDRVNAAITSRYSPKNVDVTIKDNNWVNLEGKVNSLYDKYRIFEIVSHVSGVERITNNIIVDTKRLPDHIILQNIKKDLERNSVIKEPDKIKVVVDNSMVKLSGEVSFYREKIMARTVASWEKGVRGIINNIKVKNIGKAVSDQNLENVLESLLKDEFPLTNPNNIKIKVENGFANISGTVRNLWTKRNIEDEFSSVIGIVNVINNLKVDPNLNS